jgi:hypothetical protein
MKEAFNKLCTPAKIYFAIAVIAAIIELFSGMRIIAIVMKLVFAFIWTFILAWLCKKGYKSISWFLVLLPYIIIALAMLGIYRVTKEQKQMLNAIQLQGAYGQDTKIIEGAKCKGCCPPKCVIGDASSDSSWSWSGAGAGPT